MRRPVFCDGVRDLADRYEAFILDQWGVLHDGTNAYPGVQDVLRRLADAGRRLLLLSNSGRRAALNRASLAEMGFDTDVFAAIVTSGEVTWQNMAERRDPDFAGLGRRCYLITRGGDRTVLDGLDIEAVDDPADADFIFLSGTDIPPLTLADFDPVLDAGAARSLPLICGNPDLRVVSPDGIFDAPGAVADRYAAKGGRVVYVGKPHPPVYRACLRALEGVSRDAIVAVGDSLDHDIKGADGMGIDTAFVTGGLHADDFRGDMPLAQKQEKMAALAEAHGVVPRWVIPRFAW